MSLDILLPLLGITFVSVAFWAIISATKKRAVLILIIPMMIAASVYSYVVVQRELGYPIGEDIPMDSFLVTHVVNPDRTLIFVWSVPKGEKRPRAYFIPYTKEDEEKLEEAKKKQAQGVPQSVGTDNTKKEGEKVQDTTLGQIKLYDFDVSGGVNKNAD